MAKMVAPASVTLPSRQRDALHALVADLTQVFGMRLRSVVAYGPGGRIETDELAHALVLVQQLTTDDLRQLLPSAREWPKRGLAVPLILTDHEFSRTLDVFPLEYGDIIASHVVIAGNDPFDGVQVSDADRRRGCELTAKSHVIHLREGYLETEGEAPRIARLIADSAPAFRTVLAHIVRLERRADVPDTAHDDDALAADVERIVGVPATLVNEILASVRGVSTIPDPSLLLARYIDASERVWRFVDGWKR
jgi:hypothetical protein